MTESNFDALEHLRGLLEEWWEISTGTGRIEMVLYSKYEPEVSLARTEGRLHVDELRSQIDEALRKARAYEALVQYARDVRE